MSDSYADTESRSRYVILTHDRKVLTEVTFHDLRHDFAHRAKKEAGLDDGELAVYLGHVTKRGTPAVQTTARYTQPSMDQIREKLKGMKGV